MARFHLYRYQLLPVEQHVQLEFDSHLVELDELKRRKNEFFASTVLEIDELFWSRAKINRKLVYDDQRTIALFVNAGRGHFIETVNFEMQKIEDWPSALVVIDNDPTVQIIAIEIEHRAFQKTSTLAGILQANFNRRLRRYLLHIEILPLFDKSDFWQIVEHHKGRITRIRFDMVSPNMSNIAESLRLDLHELNQNTNVQHTTLEIASDKRRSLTPSSDDITVASLVDYSSQGGGNISVKVRGIQKRIQTSDSTKEVSVGELEISANSTEQIMDVIKMLNGLTKP